MLYTAPPTLGAVSPAFVVFREGHGAEMFCEATAIPTPTLTWLREGHEVEPSSRLTLAERGRLVIKHVLRADAGLYTCHFKNAVGDTSHNIRLVVEGLYC